MYVREIKSKLVEVDGVKYWEDKLGRRRRVEVVIAAAQNRQLNPMRKVVPKRNFGSHAGGLLKKAAYDADVTMEQMAKAINMSKPSLWEMLNKKSLRLKPWMVDKIAALLGLNAEQTRIIHRQAARDRGWRI